MEFTDTEYIDSHMDFTDTVYIVLDRALYGIY